MTRASALVAGLVVLVLLGAAYAVHSRRPRRSTTVPAALVPAETLLASPRAPAGQRIRVQVINTTRIPGLARRATHVLRDQGFDVVEMTRAGPLRDSTLVLDRSGHSDWSAIIASLLKPAKVEARPDSSRYLDVTVLLGASWRPPAQPFYP